MAISICQTCSTAQVNFTKNTNIYYVGAKVSHLALLPQGEVEANERAESMVAQMDEEGFGACTNTGACSAECPKEISLDHIARLNREYYFAKQSSDNVPTGEEVHEG